MHRPGIDDNVFVIYDFLLINILDDLYSVTFALVRCSSRSGRAHLNVIKSQRILYGIHARVSRKNILFELTVVDCSNIIMII